MFPKKVASGQGVSRRSAEVSPAWFPASGGRARLSVPTTVICKELDVFKGIELLFRTAGYTEGSGTKPPILDLQIAGIHEEHMPGRQRKQENILEDVFSLELTVVLTKICTCY